MTLRVPGANGTASHRGRNASTPTSAFALHENEQPPPFPARSTNSPSCLLLLPPPPPSALSPLIALASTTPISVPSTGCRCTALFRPISLSLSLSSAPSKIRHLFALALAHFTLHDKFATLCRFLRVPLFVRLIPSVIFAGILLFPRNRFDSRRSIPREKYIIFFLAFESRSYNIRSNDGKDEKARNNNEERISISVDGFTRIKWVVNVITWINYDRTATPSNLLSFGNEVEGDFVSEFLLESIESRASWSIGPESILAFRRGDLSKEKEKEGEGEMTRRLTRVSVRRGRSDSIFARARKIKQGPGTRGSLLKIIPMRADPSPAPPTHLFPRRHSVN